MKDLGQRIQTDNSDTNIAIRVDRVSKTFRLPHNRQNSLKGSLINLAKRGERTYEKQEVLKDMSFEIKKGEFFGIVGRNGSGKSTLLKMLAGIYKPTEGCITVNGSLTPFIELGVGFNPELTGRENVFLNGALLGFNRTEIAAMYDDIVAFAEIEKFMDQKLKNYSSGMQVRLAFSIAIRAQGDILLLDEVLAVGDAAFQQKCFTYFEELKRKKRTVVFVSHDMSSVKRFCNEAVYIKEGVLLLKGSPADVADIYARENIEDNQVGQEAPQMSHSHSLTSRIVKQSTGSLVLGFSYDSKDKEGMYIGISVIKDGISVAEITTSLQKMLVGEGSVTYQLDTTRFNAGTYNIGAGLFGAHNRNVLAVAETPTPFSVKGEDITKGAALKLSDTWEYEQ